MNFATAIQAAIGADVTGLQQGGQQVESLAGRMNSALGQIGAGLTFGAVVGFFKSVTDHAGKVQDLSDRLGVSSDTLQAFTYHARQAGVDTAQASAVFDKAGKAISQLAAGEEAATKAFAALGLAQRDLLGIPLDQQVAKIASAYAGAKDRAGAFDAVTDILGAKTAPRLMAVLDQLASDGLPAFTESARQAGQVIGTETIAKLDEFGDRLDTWRGKLTSWGAGALDLFLKFGEGLGTAAASIVNDFEGINTEWAVGAELANKASAAIGEQAKKTDIVLAKTTDLARYAEADFRRLLESLGPKQAIVALEDRALKLRLEASQAAAGSAERAEKEAQAKVLFADAAKRAAEYGRLDKEQQIELGKLLAKQATDWLTPAEERRLEILNLQTKQVQIQAELQPLIEKGLTNLTPEELKRFNSLTKQSDETARQIKLKEDLITASKAHAAVEQQVAETITGYVAQWENFKLSVSTTGRGDKDLSAVELQRKANELRRDISSREGAQLGAGGVFLGNGVTSGDPFLSAQRGNLAQTQAELDFRERIKREEAFFGREQTLAFNPGLTEQRLDQILRGSVTQQERQNTVLEKLERSVQAIAPALQSLR